MKKLYLNNIKEAIENKLGEKCIWVVGETFTQEYDTVTPDGQCIALTKVSDHITDIEVTYTEHNGEYEFKYYSKDKEVGVTPFVFLWDCEYSRDKQWYYMNEQGALNGVLCINGVDLTVEEIVNK